MTLAARLRPASLVLGALLAVSLPWWAGDPYRLHLAALICVYWVLIGGLNLVVGYAGLLDLGYVAFYAVGAYMYALLASPQLTENFPWIAAMFPHGLHTPIWAVVPLAALLAEYGLFGLYAVASVK